MISAKKYRGILETCTVLCIGTIGCEKQYCKYKNFFSYSNNSQSKANLRSPTQYSSFVQNFNFNQITYQVCVLWHIADPCPVNFYLTLYYLQQHRLNLSKIFNLSEQNYQKINILLNISSVSGSQLPNHRHFQMYVFTDKLMH